MTFDDLLAEVRDDPAALGYAGRNAVGVLDRLTGAWRPDGVPTRTIRLALMTSGCWGRIRLAADDPQTDAATRRAALTVIDALSPGGFDQIDLHHSDISALVDGLFAPLRDAGLMTQQECDALYAMTANRTSRLAELGWPLPTAWQIEQILETLNG